MPGTWKRKTSTGWEESVGVLDHEHDAAYVNEGDHTKAAHDALNIDADTLDGVDSTGFATSGHNHNGAYLQAAETVVFTADGTFSKGDYDGLKFVRVRVVGGGGGGGGAGTTGSGQAAFGDGGGAGGYSEKVYAAADLAASEAVSVGAGGNGGGGAAGGADGGSSSFGTQTANGGGGGHVRPPTTTIPHTSTQAPSSRIGGNASGGDINQRGGTGGWGGIWGTSNLQVKAGDGGSSALGGGRPSPAGGNNGTSADANTGAGGTGAANGQNQTGKSGGDGAAGVVIVEVFT